MVRAVFALGLTCLLISGCGLVRPTAGEGVSAQELPFRASLKRGDDRRDITVTVRAGEATVDQVRESVRFQATRYCLSTYGGSSADWAMDPATNDWAFTRDGGDLTFSARCTAR